VLEQNFNFREPNKNVIIDPIFEREKEQLKAGPRHKKNNSSMFNKNKNERNMKEGGNIRTSIKRRAIKKKAHLTSSVLKIKKRVKKIFEKGVNINTKEILEQFSIKCEECLQIINNDITLQTLTFRENMRAKKKSEAFDARYASVQVFGSGGGERKTGQRFRQTKTSRRERTGSEDYTTPKGKASFQHMALNLNMGSTTDKKLLKKGKKRIQSINEVFEEYMTKFHFIYFQKVCENIIKSSMDIINENNKLQIKNYMKLEDQVEELLYMFNDDPETNYQKSLELMINNLKLEIDKKYLQIAIDTKHKLSGIIGHRDLFGFQEENNFIDSTDTLVKSLFKVFNN